MPPLLQARIYHQTMVQHGRYYLPIHGVLACMEEQEQFHIMGNINIRFKHKTPQLEFQPTMELVLQTRLLPYLVVLIVLRALRLVNTYMLQPVPICIILTTMVFHLHQLEVETGRPFAARVRDNMSQQL
jgi:hypothetical protein